MNIFLMIIAACRRKAPVAILEPTRCACGAAGRTGCTKLRQKAA